ncbi:MAG TPA: polymer-forming cytoskeletal protein [Myxococcota bacterium]|jgi:cytoskeletal protein CcmA (bactofilin family)|nr:polymer-forming cytoskeletal protein [Myxococcota bacterium]
MAAEGSGFIGKSITVRGTLRGESDLVVEGTVEGTIELRDQLLVQTGGRVSADVQVANLTVYGELTGSVAANAAVSINAGARVIGDISAPRVIIEDGARFKGRIEMEVPLPEGLGAPSGGGRGR